MGSIKAAPFHAYIISGPAGENRLDFAIRLAAEMVCSGEGNGPCGKCRDCRKAFERIHPDIIIATREKDKREITVNQIRELRQDAFIMPNEAERKVYIIEDADTMNTSAQNAILKTLEEPPAYAAFILLAENSDKLLSTVQSRCREMFLVPTEEKRFADDRNVNGFLDAVNSKNSVEIIRACFGLESLKKDELYDFFNNVKTIAADEIRHNAVDHKKQREYTSLVDICDMGLEYLDLNVSTGHVMGMIMSRLL